MIDAKTGEIIKRWEGLTDSMIGSGPGGNLKTGQYLYGTNFGFLDVLQSGATCTMQNANVSTVNLNNGTDSSINTPFSYACPTNNFKVTNGAYSPVNGDLALNRDIRITMKGGYDCGYTGNPSAAHLLGKVRISSGTVKLENLRFR